MCDGCAPEPGARSRPAWTRRRLLAAGGATGLALAVPLRPARARQGVEVLPRAAWAGDDLPPGPISPEPEVRFLLVHHTVNGNDYADGDVVGLLRDIHRFHTGPDKGWPDVAYNFFVDRFGRVWEGRAGSLDGPVIGDATGGNQGFDQKCAFIGDHRTEPPTPAARSAMAGLLALLADRHGLDTAPGASTSFTSRGSNLHPTGSIVTTATITGHRTMSQTACPGDAGMAFVTGELPGAVSAARAGAPTTTVAAPAPEPTSTSSTAPTTTAAPATTVPPAPTGALAAPPTTAGESWLDDAPPPLPVGVAAAAALVAGLVAVRARHLRR